VTPYSYRNVLLGSLTPFLNALSFFTQYMFLPGAKTITLQTVIVNIKDLWWQNDYPKSINQASGWLGHLPAHVSNYILPFQFKLFSSAFVFSS